MMHFPSRTLVSESQLAAEMGGSGGRIFRRCGSGGVVVEEGWRCRYKNVWR